MLRSVAIKIWNILSGYICIVEFSLRTAIIFDPIAVIEVVVIKLQPSSALIGDKESRCECLSELDFRAGCLLFN